MENSSVFSTSFNNMQIQNFSFILILINTIYHTVKYYLIKKLFINDAILYMFWTVLLKTIFHTKHILLCFIHSWFCCSIKNIIFAFNFGLLFDFYYFIFYVLLFKLAFFLFFEYLCFEQQHYLHKQTAGPWLLNFCIIKIWDFEREKKRMDYKLVMVFESRRYIIRHVTCCVGVGNILCCLED